MKFFLFHCHLTTAFLDLIYFLLPHIFLITYIILLLVVLGCLTGVNKGNYVTRQSNLINNAPLLIMPPY